MSTVTLKPIDGRHLRLELSDDLVLTILEDDGPYESFTISNPVGVIVV